MLTPQHSRDTVTSCCRGNRVAQTIFELGPLARSAPRIGCLDTIPCGEPLSFLPGRPEFRRATGRAHKNRPLLMEKATAADGLTGQLATGKTARQYGTPQKGRLPVRKPNQESEGRPRPGDHPSLPGALRWR